MIQRQHEKAASRRARLRPGLSERLLVLTVLFVMLAEVLIYVPSVANFRRNWLNDRIGAAQIAALVLDAAPAGAVPLPLSMSLLQQVGAVSVAVRSGGARRLLAASDMPPAVALDVDLRTSDYATMIRGAFSTLLATEPRFIRVVGAGMGDVEFVEIVLDETPLRQAMLAFSGRILVLSLVISGITAILVYATLLRLIVRPVRRLTSSIVAFQQEPERAGRIVQPSGRSDEIGVAERALAKMQASLADELRQKKHLAALGLAVSKINHDLRNLLSAAQLFSDRLSALSDPAAQRLAPRLIATLDRAIGFCQSTLAYGRAAERNPSPEPVDLRDLAQETAELLGLGDGGGLGFDNAVPPGLAVHADREQLSRMLLNLARNAVQALHGQPDGRVTIRAVRERGLVMIEVADNGPGVPAKARDKLFQAFAGSGRPGGTGLGLAIAAELAGLHEGSVELATEGPGAVFRITLPDRAAPPSPAVRERGRGEGRRA
ncbi:histidine kinase [Alsobacter soli]|uniref:histidine kinase n=1 Tax=Alsobacter soli TaxID=2109933 RepID=A0A2T1HWZ5_9HYPH|nr:HAMP domain-containing sensor histidine kinase [Alsobacter soli]PSC06191.1 histidine kinase [Alsobacter soli]